MPLNELDYFTENYTAARDRFLQVHRQLAAALDHAEMPDLCGPDGESLYMDFAWIGPRDADVVVVTVSGTHGAEGYCGSAMQSYAVEAGQFAHLPDGVAVLQVHASNPYGMAHFVRTNENHVDMNRNWIDFGAIPERNPIYDEVMAALPSAIEPTETNFRQWRACFDALIEAYGRWEVDDAMSCGQYHDPSGIEFGGSEAQWSRTTLTRVLGELTSAARHIVYLDWHTLLRTGNGNLIYLCFNQTGDHLFQRTGSWWGMQAIDREAVNKQWTTGTSAGARRPSRNGLMMWGVQAALAPTTDVAGAVIEFCTEPDPDFTPDELFIRELVAERYLQQTGDRHSEHWRTARAILERSIYPTNPAFRRGAITAGSWALSQALIGAGAWANESVSAAPGEITLSSTFT